MASSITVEKRGFDFDQAHAQSKDQPAYYQEGLLLEVAHQVIRSMGRLGLDRSELARRLGVSPAYVTKILRGHANMTMEILAKLAYALDQQWQCTLVLKDE